jgi:hypothetical protein
MDADLKARIERELAILEAGGQKAELIEGERLSVVYRNIGTAGTPASTDVVVPVPSGYPGSQLDLAGLPAGSTLFPRLAGAGNPQGTFSAGGGSWTLASYHPHSWPDNAWDPTVHGFHTYLQHVMSWVTVLS